MSLKGFHCTDLGNSKFFKCFVKGNLIYNYRNETWYEWTGKRWRACITGRDVEWAKDAVRAMLRHSATINDDSTREAYAKWALKSQSERAINSMMRLTRSEPIIADSGENWDLDPFMLGCPSGVLDLRSGKFLAPNKNIKIVSSIAVDPDDKAKCPQWEQFLQEVYMGDVEIIAYMKRLLGYSLTGSIKEQCVFCLYGQGANGKSTLTDTLLSLFGQYGYAMPFSTIERSNKQTISNDLAQLYGRRFVCASETQENVRLNEGRLKSITGGDVITARFMYKDLFSYKPQAHFLLAFNHKPIITDDSEGAWRRIHLIAHLRIFKKHEQNKDLLELLRLELPGILNWLIEGCIEWQQNGLLVPQSVTAATEDYRAEMNPIKQFVDEDCIAGADYRVLVNDLWETYNHWADTNRERFKLGHRQFNSRLEGMGFERKAGKDKQGHVDKYWFGLCLTNNIGHADSLRIEVVN